MAATPIRRAHLVRHTHFLWHAYFSFVGVKVNLFPRGVARGSRNVMALFRVFVTQERIELNPRHVGLGNVCEVATRTIGDGGLRCRFGIWQFVMAESEESPAICIREPLAVFDSRVNSVVGAVEEATPRGLCSRTIREGRTQNASQFFNDDRSLGK